VYICDYLSAFVLLGFCACSWKGCSERFGSERVQDEEATTLQPRSGEA
jgi:hypothetical protein